MDPVLENVLVELLVDLPADADVPIVASVTERTWLWSDLHLSDPSVRLGWGRPFGSVEEMNRHLLGNWRRRVDAGDTVICLGDIAHPHAWRDDRLVLDLAECPGERLLVLGNHDRDVPALRRAGFHKTCRTALCATGPAAGADPHTAAEGTGRGRQRPRPPGPGRPGRPTGTSTCPLSTPTTPPWDSGTSSSLPADPRNRASPRYDWICRSGWGRGVPDGRRGHGPGSGSPVVAVGGFVVNGNLDTADGFPTCVEVGRERTTRSLRPMTREAVG